VTLTGKAPSKPALATFIDKLSTLKGFSNPYITNASKTENRWDYAINVKITSAALCGRFTTPCSPTGGK
jgi:hypothetical protein